MKISELIKNTDCIVIGNKNFEISQITDDSRNVIENSLFIARKGTTENGYTFIDEAIGNGAKTILLTPDQKYIPRKNEVLLITKNIIKTTHKITDKFYNFPDSKIFLAGITGTNGKTTTTYLIENIWLKAKKNCGVIGTINYRYKNKIIQSQNTTPSYILIKQMLNEMYKNKITNAVMEVSSHGLSQGRVDGMQFDAAIFTNLTRDHLDYHKNFENYFISKKILFEILDKSKKKDKTAILNIDDKYSDRLKNSIKSKCITYGFSNQADFRVESYKSNMEGTKFVLLSPEGKMDFNIKLVGVYNLYNTLAAMALCRVSGISFEKIKEGLSGINNIPGRLTKIKLKSGAFILVDYAHTDDALFNVLSTLNEIKGEGNIFTIFGCGGDRDKSKRPLMGKVAVKLSKHVIITSDNPRTEEPESIISDIIPGIKKIKKKNYEIILDRFEAIKKGLSYLNSSDILLIAGKGHENYQVFKNKTIHFDDLEIVKELCGKNIIENN